MPIFDTGYRHWQGRLSPLWRRWWPITRNGFTLSYESKAVKRLIFFAWMSVLYFGWIFFIVGYVTEPPKEDGKDDWIRSSFNHYIGSAVASDFTDHPEKYRSLVWAYTFNQFGRYAQMFLVVLVIAIVGPGLIANDLRNKSYLVYFAKPITIGEYILGKAGVVLCYVALLTLLPSLFLYVVSICFSPSMAVVAQTIVIPLKVFLCFLVVAVPSTALILFLSSLTGDGRIAGFIWMSLWVMGEVAYEVFTNVPGTARENWPTLMSLWRNMTTVIHHIYDVPGILHNLGFGAGHSRKMTELLGETDPWMPSLMLLAALTVLCVVGTVRRVRAPLTI